MGGIRRVVEAEVVEVIAIAAVTAITTMMKGDTTAATTIGVAVLMTETAIIAGRGRVKQHDKPSLASRECFFAIRVLLAMPTYQSS